MKLSSSAAISTTTREYTEVAAMTNKRSLTLVQIRKSAVYAKVVFGAVLTLVALG